VSLLVFDGAPNHRGSGLALPGNTIKKAGLRSMDRRSFLQGSLGGVSSAVAERSTVGGAITAIGLLNGAGAAQARSAPATVPIQSLRKALDPLCVELQIPPTPQLSRTAAVWHLSTPISGRIRENSTTALDLAIALHPTPAVGGSPAGAAADLIGDLEGDRGFYAGAVGWLQFLPSTWAKYGMDATGSGYADAYNPVDAIVAGARSMGRVLLTEYESKQVLTAYGVPTVATEIARTADEAVSAANRLGYPAVLKLHSETITHKTDVGGVCLNLSLDQL